MKTVIYFLRHGEYKNKNKIIPLRLPGFPLSDKGKKQATNTAIFFKNKKITKIFSSPILRCKQTAKIIARKLNKKIKFTNLLLEVKSPYQGMDNDKFIKKTGNHIYKDPYHLNNGGETKEAIFRRVSKLIDKVLEQNMGESVLFVFHGDPIMLTIYGYVTKNLNNFFKQTITYIPMGGLVKLDFKQKSFLSFKQLNYY